MCMLCKRIQVDCLFLAVAAEAGVTVRELVFLVDVGVLLVVAVATEELLLDEFRLVEEEAVLLF